MIEDALLWLRCLVALIPPALAGYMLVDSLCARERRTGPGMIFPISLGLGLGLGASSFGYLLWLILIGAPGALYLWFESLLLLTFAALLLYHVRWRRRPKEPPAVPGTPLREPVSAPLRVSLWIALSIALAGFVLVTVYNPHGWWDAWMNWNIRARVLFRGNEHWRNAVSPLLSLAHPTYPLLLPAAVARVWTYLGSESVVAPALVAGLFTFGCVALIATGLTVLRGSTQGILGALVLLGSIYFIRHGAAQCADIPLAFYILGALVLGSLADQRPGGGAGYLVLSGAMASMAPWTKDEGLLFLVLYLGIRCAAAARLRGARSGMEEMVKLLLGAAPGLILVGYYKLGLAPSGPLHEGLMVEHFTAHLADPTRYVRVGRAFGKAVLTLGNGLPLVLALSAFLLGRRADGERAPHLNSGWMTLALMVAGELAYYLIGPTELTWILNTSLRRLLVQLWPSMVFLGFMTMKTPAETKAAGGAEEEGPG